MVGAIWPNDADGNAWASPTTGFPPADKAAGYTIVDPGRYADGTMDFSAQLSQFKSSGAQIVTGVPNEIYAERRQLAVPLMIGANNADLGLPSWKEKAQLFAAFGENEQAAQKEYDPTGNADFTSVALQVAGDTLMVEPARLITRLSSAQCSPTYEYRFSYVAESMRKDWPGAPHATEIPFVFETLGARYGDKTSSSDRATADAALSYWVAFAKTGNPGNAGGPMWPRYSAAADEILEFTNTGPRAYADPRSTRLDLIEATHQQP